MTRLDLTRLSRAAAVVLSGLLAGLRRWLPRRTVDAVQATGAAMVTPGNHTVTPRNDAAQERPIEHRSVPAHLEATAQTRAHQVALRTPSGTVSYGELVSAMHRWAGARPAGVVKPAALVVATLDVDTVAMILGLFAAGTTVVTVDPATPANRTDIIAAILDDHGYDVSRVDPDTPVPTPDHASQMPDLGDVTSIQFTSGSTGSPKAVLHTHGLWLADAQLLGDRFGLADGHKVALCMPVSFAGGLNVLIGSLLGGAEVIGIDPRVHTGRQAFDRITASGAEIITCTPSFIDVLHTAAQGATIKGIGRIVATGEAIHARHIRLARELAPHAVVTNWAGSTETLAIASHDVHPGEPLPQGVIPVGVPAPHKRIDVRDDGAVSITSEHLGGYLDPAAAAASFTENPDGTTTYAGGDVGRWDTCGNLVLSGRADSTVKIRGYLVEPAEIEVTLLSYDDIREAVVMPDRGLPSTLTAYVSPSTTTRTPAVADLRTRLHRDLPPWMVPAHIVTLPALPRGDRGKIDRSALPKPHRPALDPPRGQHEKLVSRIWSDVLHVESLGRDDSFYALGGDSMSVTQMLVALREAHGIRLQPSDLASAPTLARFAERIATTGTSGTAGLPGKTSTLSHTTVALRAVSPATVGAPLFCFTGAGASALCFAPLAERVGAQTAVYSFEPMGLAQRAFPDITIRRAARRHLADLRRIQPDGPYTLIGHSLGAHIALDVAHLLEAEGAEVEMLVMLDPWIPPKVAQDARSENPDVTVTLDAKANADARLWWDRQKRVPLAGLFFGGYGRRTLAIEEVGMMSVFFHRPQQWGGRALLVLSHLNRDDPALWSRILTGDIEFRTVDCDHHSIVREPHVGTVVEMIDAAMDKPGLDASAG
jgi:thioesterase domain-containing protein/acyl-CoA synthetase (AMP-forming)/AMP-acid ligase II/acyl carrier protein